MYNDQWAKVKLSSKFEKRGSRLYPELAINYHITISEENKLKLYTLQWTKVKQ